MTTTELIELLKKYEYGAATGRPREVMFEVDDEIFKTDGIEITGSGDGLLTELFLSLPNAKRKKGKWIKDKYGNVLCSECKWYAPSVMQGSLTNRHLGYEKSNFCWNCGAKMEAER